MANTRFNYDVCRTEKRLQESTGPGRYMLNVPGNGDKPCYMEDPYIRLQQWGANLRTNPIQLESELLGLDRRAGNKDCIEANAPKYNIGSAVAYPTCGPVTQQPRATDPAWTARDLEQTNWWTLPLNPQENVCIPFRHNENTQLLARDYFVACPPHIEDNEDGTMTTIKNN